MIVTDRKSFLAIGKWFFAGWHFKSNFAFVHFRLFTRVWNKVLWDGVS